MVLVVWYWEATRTLCNISTVFCLISSVMPLRRVISALVIFMRISRICRLLEQTALNVESKSFYTILKTGNKLGCIYCLFRRFDENTIHVEKAVHQLLLSSKYENRITKCNVILLNSLIFTENILRAFYFIFQINYVVKQAETSMRE